MLATLQIHCFLDVSLPSPSNLTYYMKSLSKLFEGYEVGLHELYLEFSIPGAVSSHTFTLQFTNRIIVAILIANNL